MAVKRHVVGNVLAVGRGYENYVDAWHLIEHERGPSELLVRGRYLQRVQRRNDCWAFSYDSEAIEFGSEQGAGRSWLDDQRGLPRGARGKDDTSTCLMTTGDGAR